MDQKIKLRPHHFMCTIGFRGKGYSTDFVRNYKKLMAKMHENENILVEVAEYMDSICSACPNKIDEVICKNQEKVIRLDIAHTKVLDIKPGEIMSWHEAKKKIKNNMSIEKFHSACASCSWKNYGVCEQSLKELINSIVN